MQSKARAAAILLLTLMGTLLLSAQAADKANRTGKQTLTGEISDDMCGPKHMMDGSTADCTRECVKNGSNYALVVGDQVYKLKGHKQEVDKFAGQHATVTGDLNGGTLEVESVAAAK